MKNKKHIAILATALLSMSAFTAYPSISTMTVLAEEMDKMSESKEGMDKMSESKDEMDNKSESKDQMDDNSESKEEMGEEFQARKPKELVNNFEDLKPYGKKIMVKGKEMNVYEIGEGKKTLVVFPGLGEYSARYTYTNLFKRLSKDYKIVVIEPFGTGLSEDTDQPRTVENIVDDYHEAIKQLGLKDYTILAHSIGGIYALNYVDKYRDEEGIKGFIGMDTSTPVQDGGMKIPQEAMTEEELDSTDLPDVDAEDQAEYIKLAKARMNTVAVWDEADRVAENFKKSEDVKFPKGFKAMYLLAKDMVESRKEFGEAIGLKEGWEEQHIALSEDKNDAKTHVLEGNHLLYLTAYNEIADKIDEFTNSLE